MRKYLLPASVLAIIVFFVSQMTYKPNVAIGSTPQGGEYHATTTQGVSGATSTTTVISIGAGTFGSVIITGAGSGTQSYYDGTTTSNHPDWATTTLAVFPSSTAAGTYTFDIAVQKGLIVVYSNYTGTTTTTYR